MYVDVIYEYSLQEAILDGIVIEVFKNRWVRLTGGKPIVASSAVYSWFSQAALIEIWNEYIDWRSQVMPTLPEEDQLFSTQMNDRKIWLIEDGQAFTILFPEDY